MPAINLPGTCCSNGSDVSEAVSHRTAIKTPTCYRMRIGDVWRENAKEGLTFIEGENYFVNDVFLPNGRIS